LGAVYAGQRSLRLESRTFPDSSAQRPDEDSDIVLRASSVKLVED
jgi:hypothetical protein